MTAKKPAEGTPKPYQLDDLILKLQQIRIKIGNPMLYMPDEAPLTSVDIAVNEGSQTANINLNMS